MNKHYLSDLDEEQPMTEQQINRDFDYREIKDRTALKLIGITFLVLVALFCASQVVAQTSCTATSTTPCIGVTKQTGEAPLDTSVIWSYPGAATCTAGGAANRAAWTGTIPCSGTRTLSSISGKLTLTLDANAAGTTNKFQLKFTRPTTNTDGSALALLGGYLVEYGTAAGSLTQTLSVPLSAVTALTPTAAAPQDSSYTIEGLAPGTWFASLRARTQGCFPATTATCYESLRSAVVQRTIATSPGAALPQLSVTIEPYSVPSAPTNVVATEVTAFRIEPNADGTLLATRVELVPLSTTCEDDRCVVTTRLQ